MTIADTIFDKEFLTIYYEQEHKLLHLKWKGFANTDQFRDGLNFALEAVIEHHVENWLGNLKLMETILPNDEEWASTVWFPKIAHSSIKKMGIVTSLDYFNNTSVKRIVNAVVPVINFETRYFVDVDQAKQWLLNDL